MPLKNMGVGASLPHLFPFSASQPHPRSFQKGQVSKSEGSAFHPCQAAAVPASATRGRGRQWMAVLVGSVRPPSGYLRGSLPASLFWQRRRPQIQAPRAKAATATAPVTSSAKESPGEAVVVCGRGTGAGRGGAG